MYVESLSESAIAKQCDENSAAIKALSEAIAEILPIIPTQLATVAITGDYDDLIDKPVIPVVPELAAVATSGDYDDLLNKPVIPVVPELAAVATSGDYDDLVDKPLFATVATTGDYDDLLNKPVIPVVPTLATVATSGDYDDLDNKPSIPSISGLAETDLGNVVLPTADAGKYLKIAADGSIEYDTPSGGTSSSIVQLFAHGGSWSTAVYDAAEAQLQVGDLVMIPSQSFNWFVQAAADDWNTAPATATNHLVRCHIPTLVGKVTGITSGTRIEVSCASSSVGWDNDGNFLAYLRWSGVMISRNQGIAFNGNECFAINGAGKFSVGYLATTINSGGLFKLVPSQ